jgi:hypothetical protein
MESKNPSEGPLTELDKAKADLILELSKKATDRFNKRKDYEWKLSFGLWAALGSAAGFVWQADAATPVLAFFCATLITVLIVCAYYWLIVSWMDNSHRRDLKTSYYWESVLCHLVGVPLCPGLEPTKDLKDGIWPTFPHKPEHEGKEIKESLLRRFHYAVGGQLAITVLLALLLVAALFVKTFTGSPVSDEGSLHLQGQIRNKVTIEN